MAETPERCRHNGDPEFCTFCRIEAANPQSVAAQPEGAERPADRLSAVEAERDEAQSKLRSLRTGNCDCRDDHASWCIVGQRDAEHDRAEQLKAERDEARRKRDALNETLGNERATMGGRIAEAQHRAEAAEQRIESLERALLVNAEFFAWLKQEYPAALVAAPTHLIERLKRSEAVLDTTQADQRQAAFPHEERMQAVDEAIEEVREADGG